MNQTSIKHHETPNKSKLNSNNHRRTTTKEQSTVNNQHTHILIYPTTSNRHQQATLTNQATTQTCKVGHENTEVVWIGTGLLQSSRKWDKHMNITYIIIYIYIFNRNDIINYIYINTKHWQLSWLNHIQDAKNSTSPNMSCWCCAKVHLAKAMGKGWWGKGRFGKWHGMRSASDSTEMGKAPKCWIPSIYCCIYIYISTSHIPSIFLDLPLTLDLSF